MMRSIVFISLFVLFLQGLAFAKPTPSKKEYLNQDESGFSLFGQKPQINEETETYRLLDQNRIDNMNRNPITGQSSLDKGKARAEQMVEMIKNDELRRALEKVTRQSEAALRENPEYRTPLGIIAGAVGLWMGSTVRLKRDDDFKLSTRVEARNKLSEMSIESKLLNGRLSYSGFDGVDISMNRMISSIRSQAELRYNLRYQTISTQVRHRIAPNLDLSFGTSQIPQTSTLDQNARIEYRISF